MENELKTLKELEWYNKEEIARKDFVGIALQSRRKKGIEKGLGVKIDINPAFVYTPLLRQEAIKWINYMENIDDNWMYKIGLSEEDKKNYLKNLNWWSIEAVTKQFIKHFFNIIEEEIANEKSINRKIE